MPSVRDARRAQERSARLARVNAAVIAAFPDLDLDIVAEMLDAARATKGIPLRDLDAFFADHPDALTSGDPRCPPAVIRLTRALHDSGNAAVVQPGCAGCGKLVSGGDRH